jgi:hypothetical protein
VPVRRLFLLTSSCCCLAIGVSQADGAGLFDSKTLFGFKDSKGRVQTAPIIDQYRPDQIVHPFAKIDRRMDPKLLRAATIAQERARAHSRRRCWAYVKEALMASGAIDSRPKTAYARDAGEELVRDYGFKKLSVTDPYAAPLGAVLVYYKGPRKPGHVEIRTTDGFVSDYRTKTPSPHPLLGVYAKNS